jgi:hypothetical protein
MSNLLGRVLMTAWRTIQLPAAEPTSTTVDSDTDCETSPDHQLDDQVSSDIDTLTP